MVALVDEEEETVLGGWVIVAGRKARAAPM